MGCSALEEITIPETVIYISDAFQECPALRNVIFRGILFPVDAFCALDVFSTADDAVFHIMKALSPYEQKTEEDLITPQIASIYQYLFRSYCKSPEDKFLSEFVHQNLKQMFSSLILMKDTSSVRYLLEKSSLITKENITDWILYANQKESYEIQVILSEYQHKTLGYDSIEETVRKKFEL